MEERRRKVEIWRARRNRAANAADNLEKEKEREKEEVELFICSSAARFQLFVIFPVLHFSRQGEQRKEDLESGG